MNRCFRHHRAALVLSLAAICSQTALFSTETISSTLLSDFTQGFPSENGPFELYTSVVHSQGVTYVVMPNANRIPKVTQITEGSGGATKLTVDLDPDTADQYKTINDAHNGFSIGIDEDGYIHIAGDMHNYGHADGRQGNENIAYPDRYKSNNSVNQNGNTILYWVSKKPRDISDGFEFVGNTSQKIPGIGWSYGRFFNDINGKLYYSARGSAYTNHNTNNGGQTRGALAVTLNSYDVVTRTWTTLGDIPPSPEVLSTHNPRKVLLWSYAGEPPHPAKPGTNRNYQVYQAAFNFDLNNRLHFAASTYYNYEGDSRVVYAYSDDGGVSWHRTDGTSVGLPMRGEFGLANSLTSAGYGSGGSDSHSKYFPSGLTFNPNGSYNSGTFGSVTRITKVVADANGNVGVLHGTTEDNWRTWFGSGQWTSGGNKMVGQAATIDGQGVVTTWGTNGKIGRSPDITAPMTIHTGAGSIISPSQLEIQKSGTLYGLVKPTSTTMRVKKISFTSPPASTGLGFTIARWNNIPGRSIAELVNSPDYPRNPASVALSPVGDTFSVNYSPVPANGTRLRGYFIPPVTGSYTFYITTQYSGRVRLSTDDSPVNLATIINVHDTAIPKNQWEWIPQQKSAPITLQANNRYFIEVLHKGAGTANHIAVGVKYVDNATSIETTERPLSADRLDPWVNKAPIIRAGITVAPAGTNQKALSVIGEDEYPESTLHYSWSATGPASVTFNPNNAKNCTATFSQPGTYLCRVTVTDQDGATASTSTKIVIP